MADLPEGVAQLVDAFPYDGRRFFFHSAGALPDEKDQGKGEGGPPESHGKKGELDALAAARQAERGRREGHPHVEGEENPSPEVTHGKAQRRDEIPSRLQGHRRQQRVVKDDGPGKAYHGSDVASRRRLPAAAGDQVKCGSHDDPDGSEKEEKLLFCLAPVGDGTEHGCHERHEDSRRRVGKPQLSRAHNGIGPHGPVFLEKDREEGGHDGGGKGRVRPVIHSPPEYGFAVFLHFPYPFCLTKNPPRFAKGFSVKGSRTWHHFPLEILATLARSLSACELDTLRFTRMSVGVTGLS